MIPRPYFLILVLLGIFSSGLHAQTTAEKDGRSVQLFVGHAYRQSRITRSSGEYRDLKQGIFDIGVELRRDRISHRFSVSSPSHLQWYKITGDLDLSGGAVSATERILNVAANYQLVYRPMAKSDKRLQPYFGAGVHAAYGYQRYRFLQTGSTEQLSELALGFSLEAGVEYRITDRISIQGGLRLGQIAMLFDTRILEVKLPAPGGIYSRTLMNDLTGSGIRIGVNIDLSKRQLDSPPRTPR